MRYGYPDSRDRSTEREQKAIKRHGQHFLRAASIAQRIVHLAGVQSDDWVLEVGPGTGALSGPLLQQGARVLAVEIDPALIPGLRSRFPALRLECADILHVDLSRLLDDHAGTTARWKLVSNLPYHEATAILQRCVEIKTQLDSATVMVQREVAERLLADPGSRCIGFLTHLLGYHFQMRPGFTVRPGAFSPPPKVYSSVMQLFPRTDASPVADYDFYVRLLQHAFGQRRKTLRNSLRGLGIADDLLLAGLQERGLSPQARAESLTRADFVWLAGALRAEGTPGVTD